MIPPLLLDVHPGHVVLDLCAAPGSKAAQLLEMIHQGEEGRILKALQMHATEDGREVPEFRGLDDVDMEADPVDDGRATGMLIANDMDYKRSHLLIHQLKRLSSPNMIVTNHDATLFPSLKLPSEDPKKQNYLKFDRILADVPCSGDGTLRKNVNLWKDWIPGNALGLHQTQVRILVRALQMLKTGGRVVYSTCSMNPVENESVVAAAIERCGIENVELLDCSNELPGLKRTTGMKEWKVMDKAGRIWNSWEEVEKWAATESKDGALPGKVMHTMFPRKQDENTPEIPLQRCLRVYAHQQDTGGFFIVALHKKKEFKAKPENWASIPPKSAAQAASTLKVGKEATAAAGSEQTSEQTSEVKAEEVKTEEVENKDKTAVESSNPLKRTHKDEEPQAPQKRQHTEDITPGNGDSKEQKAPADDQAMNQDEQANDNTTVEQKTQPKSDGYGDKAAKKANKEPFEEPFKYLDSDNEVIKNVSEFYNISPRFPTDRFMVRNAAGEPAKAIYYTSALVRDVLTSNEGRSVKFVHGGVKMLMKQEAPSAEVCRWRIQSEGMPILQGYVGQQRVVVLHKKETLRKLLIEMFPRVNGDEWKKLDEIGERVRDIGLGCLVLRIEPDGTEDDFTERMALPLWKSFHSLNLMLPKEDRSAMLLRIYNDTTPLVNVMLKDKQKGDDQNKTEVENGAEEVAVSTEDAEVEAVADAEAEMAEADDNIAPGDDAGTEDAMV